MAPAAFAMQRQKPLERIAPTTKQRIVQEEADNSNNSNNDNNSNDEDESEDDEGSEALDFRCAVCHVQVPAQQVRVHLCAMNFYRRISVAFAPDEYIARGSSIELEGLRSVEYLDLDVSIARTKPRKPAKLKRKKTAAAAAAAAVKADILAGSDGGGGGGGGGAKSTKSGKSSASKNQSGGKKTTLPTHQPPTIAAASPSQRPGEAATDIDDVTTDAEFEASTRQLHHLKLQPSQDIAPEFVPGIDDLGSRPNASQAFIPPKAAREHGFSVIFDKFKPSDIGIMSDREDNDVDFPLDTSQFGEDLSDYDDLGRGSGNKARATLHLDQLLAQAGRAVAELGPISEANSEDNDVAVAAEAAAKAREEAEAEADAERERLRMRERREYNRARRQQVVSIMPPLLPRPMVQAVTVKLSGSEPVVPTSQLRTDEVVASAAGAARAPSPSRRSYAAKSLAARSERRLTRKLEKALDEDNDILVIPAESPATPSPVFSNIPSLTASFNPLKTSVNNRLSMAFPGMGNAARWQNPSAAPSVPPVPPAPSASSSETAAATSASSNVVPSAVDAAAVLESIESWNHSSPRPSIAIHKSPSMTEMNLLQLAAEAEKLRQLRTDDSINAGAGTSSSATHDDQAPIPSGPTIIGTTKKRVKKKVIAAGAVAPGVAPINEASGADTGSGPIPARPVRQRIPKSKLAQQATIDDPTSGIKVSVAKVVKGNKPSSSTAVDAADAAREAGYLSSGEAKLRIQAKLRRATPGISLGLLGAGVDDDDDDDDGEDGGVGDSGGTSSADATASGGAATAAPPPRPIDRTHSLAASIQFSDPDKEDAYAKLAGKPRKTKKTRPVHVDGDQVAAVPISPEGGAGNVPLRKLKKIKKSDFLNGSLAGTNVRIVPKELATLVNELQHDLDAAASPELTSRRASEDVPPPVAVAETRPKRGARGARAAMTQDDVARIQAAIAATVAPSPATDSPILHSMSNPESCAQCGSRFRPGEAAVHRSDKPSDHYHARCLTCASCQTRLFPCTGGSRRSAGIFTIFGGDASRFYCDSAACLSASALANNGRPADVAFELVPSNQVASEMIQ
ncbi:hypothetical protein GQ42DRAFT_161282 [Ramicandelaber brevisporus]|nr:hypothetical protein GQ42DRAFT_161282 [Ramicandelaber brevisporus]